MDPRLLNRTNWKTNDKKETNSFLKKNKNNNKELEWEKINPQQQNIKEEVEVDGGVAIRTDENSKGYFSNVPAFIWYILGAGALLYVAKKQKLF
tara:strand:- start:201 stop:482 length:282 start_codon:yes stop_codon:yes gene_type:complete